MSLLKYPCTYKMTISYRCFSHCNYLAATRADYHFQPSLLMIMCTDQFVSPILIKRFFFSLIWTNWSLLKLNNSSIVTLFCIVPCMAFSQIFTSLTRRLIEWLGTWTHYLASNLSVHISSWFIFIYAHKTAKAKIICSIHPNCDTVTDILYRIPDTNRCTLLSVIQQFLPWFSFQ